MIYICYMTCIRYMTYICYMTCISFMICSSQGYPFLLQKCKGKISRRQDKGHAKLLGKSRMIPDIGIFVKSI